MARNIATLQLFSPSLLFSAFTETTVYGFAICHCLQVMSCHRYWFCLQGTTMLFICGQNSSSNETFFRAKERNDGNNTLTELETVRPHINTEEYKLFWCSCLKKCTYWCHVKWATLRLTSKNGKIKSQLYILFMINEIQIYVLFNAFNRPFPLLH